MVYVQIKSAYLISLQCIGGTLNEHVSLRPFHCQRNYRQYRIAAAVDCLAPVGEDLFLFYAALS